METDAKGQLGGLESSDAVRRRVANESRSWKCSSCAKTNAEIMAECEEAAKQCETKPEEAVPAELKMGFKDELGKKQDNASDNGESAELAEGFVQTVPVVAEEMPQTAPTQPAAYPPARPAQGVPQPTATIPLPAMRPAEMRQMHRLPNSDGVPAWVDKAIMAVVACLLAVIAKLILGL